MRARQFINEGRYPMPLKPFRGYTYVGDVEEEEDNRKIFHDVKTPEGKLIHMDMSPYHVVTQDEFELWIRLGMPSRNDNPKGPRAGNLDRDDLFALAQQRGLDEGRDTPLRDIEDYNAKRKALQDIQIDPSTAKDPQLKAELQRRLQSLEKQKAELPEDMTSYDKEDPYNSEFAPRVGMGSRTLRGWKKTMTARVEDLLKRLNTADIDKDMLWDGVYKLLKGYNLDPIAQEIELAHDTLEKERRKGGVRSRAFKQDVTEGLNVGDEVIITGPVEHKGETGVIDSFGQGNRFVVVNLYNHGKRSFHSSDVSYNDYADSDAEEAEMYDRDPDFRKWADSQVDEGLKDPKDNPCWKGYKPVGTKKKNGKTVPNCVPKE